MAHQQADFTVLGQPLAREDLVTEPLPTAVDDDEFTPRHLALLSNALVWAQSQAFRAEVGFATNDWRVLSALASHPGRTATDISESLSVNKAIVSTTVNSLAAQGLIVLVDGPRGSQPMYLTSEGAALHDRMVPIAMKGQQLIDEELSLEERERLNALLRTLTARAQSLNRAPRRGPVREARGGE